MRIALLFNSRAGRSEEGPDVCAIIDSAGHSVTQLLDFDTSDPRMLESTVELIVAAGGDGTVAKAARLAYGSGLPIGILPMGTANNVALSLGIAGELSEIARRWSCPRRLTVDLGLARTQHGEHIFVEGVGAGLVPAVIDSMNAESRARREEADVRVERAIERYRELLPLLTPKRWTVTADGVPFTGDLLMFELLNTAAVGPNLTLSHETSATDGLLSLVMIGEENREQLTALLDNDGLPHGSMPALPVIHVREVVIEGRDAMHIDDRLYWPGSAARTEISVKPGAITVLA